MLLSYMLFNWVNDRYGLYLKLEIAEFIKTQEEMIENYLKPIIEHIEKNGRGKTKGSRWNLGTDSFREVER